MVDYVGDGRSLAAAVGRFGMEAFFASVVRGEDCTDGGSLFDQYQYSGSKEQVTVCTNGCTTHYVNVISTEINCLIIIK